jgi:hypothetical protein
MFHTKAQLTIGDILWLLLLPGDNPKLRRHAYYSDKSDSDDVDPVSIAVRAKYVALGLDRDFCDHPCVVVDLLDGRNGDETRVSVCIVSVLKYVLATMNFKADPQCR